MFARKTSDCDHFCHYGTGREHATTMEIEEAQDLLRLFADRLYLPCYGIYLALDEE